MAFENEGFAAEQIDAPQAVFRMTEYCRQEGPYAPGSGR